MHRNYTGPITSDMIVGLEKYAKRLGLTIKIITSPKQSTILINGDAFTITKIFAGKIQLTSTMSMRQFLIPHPTTLLKKKPSTQSRHVTYETRRDLL